MTHIARAHQFRADDRSALLHWHNLHEDFSSNTACPCKLLIRSELFFLFCVTGGRRMSRSSSKERSPRRIRASTVISVARLLLLQSALCSQFYGKKLAVHIQSAQSLISRSEFCFLVRACMKRRMNTTGQISGRSKRSFIV